VFVTVEVQPATFVVADGRRDTACVSVSPGVVQQGFEGEEKGVGLLFIESADATGTIDVQCKQTRNVFDGYAALGCCTPRPFVFILGTYKITRLCMTPSRLQLGYIV
jgi:hypothetical protein